jgi:hypothetical protein
MADTNKLVGGPVAPRWGPPGLSNLFLGIKSFLDTFFQKSICFSYFVNAALMVRVTWVPINGA